MEIRTDKVSRVTGNLENIAKVETNLSSMFVRQMWKMTSLCGLEMRLGRAKL